jgi:hypothetical protein
LNQVSYRHDVSAGLCISFTSTAGDKAAAVAEKEGTKKWRAALVAARPEVPAAGSAPRQRKKRVAQNKDADLDELEDLEDPVVAEGQQFGDDNDDQDHFDDAGSPMPLCFMT